jgi:hypothetical protein
MDDEQLLWLKISPVAHPLEVAGEPRRRRAAGIVLQPKP